MIIEVKKTYIKNIYKKGIDNMRYFIINENMEKLARDKKLRPIELMVMANIYSFYNSKKECKESMKSFADRFGVTYPTIMKCFDNLVNKNIIVKGEKLDRNNNIWLLSDETIKAIDGTQTENNQENTQESKQDNKQEDAKEEPKEEKAVNTTHEEEKAENKPNISYNNDMKYDMELRKRMENYTGTDYLQFLQ